MGKSQDEQEPQLVERERESDREHEEEKIDFTVMEGRLQGGEGGKQEKLAKEK